MEVIVVMVEARVLFADPPGIYQGSSPRAKSISVFPPGTFYKSSTYGKIGHHLVFDIF